MPKKRQALVEYEDLNGSSTSVTYAADNQVYIAGHPAFINYSTSQKISRPGDSDDSRSVNNVLLLTIMNPIYPITSVNGHFILDHKGNCCFSIVWLQLMILHIDSFLGWHKHPHKIYTWSSEVDGNSYFFWTCSHHIWTNKWIWGKARLGGAKLGGGFIRQVWS